MYLSVALRTVRVKHLPKRGNSVNRRVPEAAMTRVAPQTQERRRLFQEIVGDRSVRIVTDGAVFFHGRMPVNKRPSLLRVAVVADHIDGGFLEVVLGRAVGIVAVGAHHLPFAHGVVRRHFKQRHDLLVTFVTRGGLVDRHWQPFRPIDNVVIDVDGAKDLI